MTGVAGRRTLFFPAKDERLARKVSTESPRRFRGSIRKVKRDGRVTAEEKRALVLARNRAAAQLQRKDLSPSERRQFRRIRRTRLPPTGPVGRKKPGFRGLGEGPVRL